MADHVDDIADGAAYLDLEDKMTAKSSRGGRSSRGGKSGPSGSKSGQAGGGQKREVQISKALSKLLRHQAASAGIPLDPQGFAPLDRVVSSLF